MRRESADLGLRYFRMGGQQAKGPEQQRRAQEIGRRIKLARERIRPTMNQESLGLSIGKSGLTTVSSWERGASSPHAYDLAPLCEALGESASWLIGEKAAVPGSYSALLQHIGATLKHHRLMALCDMPDATLRRLIDQIIASYHDNPDR
jgi:transcriptional regulator with XRE-family HTH domain